MYFQGQRQRKLEARKLREKKEEEEKKQIDLEEAKYQAQQRKDAIDKAKTQQYYQTDRVKGFHVGEIILFHIALDQALFYCGLSTLAISSQKHTYIILTPLNPTFM